MSRLGAGTITIAFCAALPGCNLAIYSPPTDCVGEPSSRGMSSVECPVDANSPRDSAGDVTSDSARDTTDAPVGDAAGDLP